MHILPLPPLPTAFTVGQPQPHHALPADGALSTTMRGKLERCGLCLIYTRLAFS